MEVVGSLHRHTRTHTCHVQMSTILVIHVTATCSHLLQAAGSQQHPNNAWLTVMCIACEYPYCILGETFIISNYITAEKIIIA